MTLLDAARAAVAERMPECLTDSMGRTHRCIPREAILRGDWDGGSLVRAALVERGEGA